MPLRDKNILVTGATGFIGSRLAYRLLREEGAIVTGIGRDLDKVPFLRQAGATLRRLDLTEPAALPEILRGQEILFHLAVAPSFNDPETLQRVNITATANLVRVAAEAGLSRFVHVSSMAAYGPPDGRPMTEDRPVSTQQRSPYGQSKALGEIQAVKLARELGLALTIIRPGMVIGPEGRSWTMELVKLVKKRVPVILGDGTGFAQPVYFDNLIDGLILAAARAEAAGEAFNFVDCSIPWRDFFAYYGKMCGRKPLRIPAWLAKIVLTLVGPSIGRREPPDDLLAFYNSRSIYPQEKAERLLGHRSKVSLDEAMKNIEIRLREAGHIN